jgi:hypothetical protein
MIRMPSPLALLAAFAVAGAAACGGGDSSDPLIDNSSILGGNEVTYLEAAEATNNTEATSEVTGYTLDVDGIRIEGDFEAGSPSNDYYRFDTGAFTHVDVQVFVDGAKQAEANYVVGTTLNAYVDDGYSTLSGHGYFINAWLSGTHKSYVLGISGPPGKSYAIEMKGH